MAKNKRPNLWQDLENVLDSLRQTVERMRAVADSAKRSAALTKASTARLREMNRQIQETAASMRATNDRFEQANRSVSQTAKLVEGTAKAAGHLAQAFDSLAKTKKPLENISQAFGDCNSRLPATKEFLESKGLSHIDQLDEAGRQELEEHLVTMIKLLQVPHSDQPN